MQIKENENSYSLPDGSSIRKGADGEAGDRLAAILADPTTVIIPYVPPPPPTPAEKRAAKYAQRVDQWSLSITRYQARLLDPLLDDVKKAKIQTKLDASVLKVQTLSTQIENEDPD